MTGNLNRVHGPVLTSTTDICLTVRDIAKEWLRRVQEALPGRRRDKHL
jgi:hypothetical protein